MAGKPKVFVTRRIPAAGLDRIRQHCDAEVWPEQMPPPYDLLKRKLADCDGLVSLLTDRIDATLMDAAARRLVESVHYAQSGQWKTWEPLGHLGQDLAGRTLGVVGMGRIGSALARCCRFGWDMRVLYAAPAPTPSSLSVRRVQSSLCPLSDSR